MKVTVGQMEQVGSKGACMQKFLLEAAPGGWPLEGRMFLRSGAEAVPAGFYTVNPADCLVVEQIVVPSAVAGRMRSQSMIVFRVRPENLVPLKAGQAAKVA